MLRVPVDFNTMDWDSDERVWINTLLHRELGNALHPGLTVLLYDTDLEVEAIIEHDDRHPVRQWLAKPNWSTARDLPFPR